MIKCKHYCCDKPAYKPYTKEGITMCACKEHLKIIIDYWKQQIKEEEGK